jgi:hypothetical protein
MQPGRSTVRIALVAVLLMAVLLKAMAHHSTAEFDYTQTLTIEGEVNEVQWTNPHSFLQVLVSAEGSDTPVQWSIEIGSPALNARAGWRRDSVVVGDRVSMTIAPARNGTPYGTLRIVTKEDGREFRGAAANVSGTVGGGGGGGGGGQ